MHPVRFFIENKLKETTMNYAKKNGQYQSVYSNWYIRKKPVETLPVWVIKQFSTDSGMSMDEVYDLLIEKEK